MADFPLTTYEERLKKTELVIKGEVISINTIKFTDEIHPRKVAVVQVVETFKGTADSNILLVSVGNLWPNGLRSSQDIDVSKGDIAKWLLVKDKTGLFNLNNPDNFVKTIK